MFLQIFQTSQGSTCVGVFFYEVTDLQPAGFLKKILQHTCFPVKISKLLRTPTLKNICKRLLLEVFYKKDVLWTFNLRPVSMGIERPILHNFLNLCEMFYERFSQKTEFTFS